MRRSHLTPALPAPLTCISPSFAGHVLRLGAGLAIPSDLHSSRGEYTAGLGAAVAFATLLFSAQVQLGRPVLQAKLLQKLCPLHSLTGLLCSPSDSQQVISRGSP